MKCTCPVCKRYVEAPPADQLKEGDVFPFCSQRCKLIDLGAWLDAEYAIASEFQPNSPTEQAGASEADDTARQ